MSNFKEMKPETYACLLEGKNCFTKSQLIARYESLIEKMSVFIEGTNRNAKINYQALQMAVVDYFSDIRRLKDFHGIEKANVTKIDSYMAFWLLKRHPIQVLDISEECDYEKTFINEQFICSYFLASIVDIAHIDADNDKNAKLLGEFLKDLYYFLKYRIVNPQALELAFAFFKLGVELEKSDHLDEQND